MAANQIPDNKKRDGIVQEGSGPAGGSPKRADTINGSPRTKSAGSSGPAFSPHKSSDLNSAPPPNNPYGR